jgi:hypothetical protein
MGEGGGGRGLLAISVETQLLCGPASDLRHLERVCEPVVQSAPRVGSRDLRNADEALERGCIEDAIVIALGLCAISRRILFFEPQRLFRPGHAATLRVVS